MTAAAAPRPEVRRVFRRGAWVAAVAAVLVGLFGLIFPQTALGAIALLAGVYLIVSGIMRFSTAIASTTLAASWRWVLGAVGVLLVAGGVLVLNDPFGALVAVAIVTGIGWIIDGLGYLVAAFALRGGSSAVPLVIAGVLLIAAGIVLLLVPGAALSTFFFWLAIMLLIFGVLSLAALAATVGRRRRAA